MLRKMIMWAMMTTMMRMIMSTPIYVDFYDFLDDDNDDDEDDDQDLDKDEEDADDVPCRTRGCRLADSSAQPWESSENCGGGPCTANPQTALH